MAADAAQRRATYEDVLNTPEHLTAQVIDGELYTSPRPAMPHAMAATALGEELGPPFKRGRGGPGGWILVFEPELHLGEDIVVPDLGGWRRETLPQVPKAPFLDVAPDFCCEVLSPATQRIDRILKLPLYAREGVAHVWLVDPIYRTLEVYELRDGVYALVASHSETERVRAVPFDAIELDLSILWEGVERTPIPER